METYKMYVSVVNQRVYSYPDDSPWEYEVNVTREFVPVFKNLFSQADTLEILNFVRSHFPPLPDYYGGFNEDIEKRTKKVYALIHEFSDDETKSFIETLPYFR